MPRIVVRPALATVLLHGLLIYLLTANWSSMERERIRVKPAPLNVVNARLVDAAELQAKPKPPPPKPKPEPPKPKPEPPKPKPEPPKPKPEPPKPKPEPPKPKPEPKPAPKPAPKPEPRPAPKPEPPKPTPQEQSRLDALARIAADELSPSQTATATATSTATADEMSASFIALIQRTVVNYWSRPPSARNGMECELLVQLVPTGEVVSVTVVRSSGNSAFDRSAVNAVQKAGAFPELQKLPSGEFERRFRRLNLIFKPEDLRY